MQLEDYPPQEPLPEFARSYHEAVWQRSKGITVREAQYGPDPYQGIALAVPPKPNGSVLVFMHGGGWTCGYKEWNLFMAPLLNDAGVILASVGYRLAPGTLFPGNFEDSARGLAWLYANIARHGGDPQRLFVGGHSAGGHLAALLAVRQDWQAALGLPPDVVRGCLPISGVYLFGADAGLSKRPRFLGEAEDAALDAAASPLAHLRSRAAHGVPPFLLAWGEKDFPHLIVQAHAMLALLREKKADVSDLVLAGKTHLEAHLASAEPDQPWIGAAVRFIETR